MCMRCISAVIMIPAGTGPYVLSEAKPIGPAWPCRALRHLADMSRDRGDLSAMKQLRWSKRRTSTACDRREPPRIFGMSVWKDSPQYFVFNNYMHGRPRVRIWQSLDRMDRSDSIRLAGTGPLCDEQIWWRNRGNPQRWRDRLGGATMGRRYRSFHGHLAASGLLS
jgi:hypothetical protein